MKILSIQKKKASAVHFGLFISERAFVNVTGSVYLQYKIPSYQIVGHKQYFILLFLTCSTLLNSLKHLHAPRKADRQTYRQDHKGKKERQ